MEWFAAHVIERFDVIDAIAADRIMFYENVVLINAENSEAAWRLAEGMSKHYDNDDESTALGNRPARVRFAGIRKLIECSTVPGQTRFREAGEPLAHGDEVTYSLMSVRNEIDMQKLLNGKSVSVVYRE